MNKINVTVSFGDDKLDALTYFMKKDNTDPQKALQGELEKLYEKYIPAEMREYLESRSAARDRSKRPSRPSPAKQKQVTAEAKELTADTLSEQTPPQMEPGM